MYFGHGGLRFSQRESVKGCPFGLSVGFIGGLPIGRSFGSLSRFGRLLDGVVH